MLETPARVVVVPGGEALGCRRLGRRWGGGGGGGPRGGRLGGFGAFVRGAWRRWAAGPRRSSLLVGGGLLHLPLPLGLLLAGGEIGFAAVQDLLEPGQAHGGPAL